MNFSNSEFLQLVEPLSTTVSSPRLDSIVLAWDHIANRYLRRHEANRIFAGRVRSIRLLAVHDAIHSVIDPGNGYIFKEISSGSSTEASLAAAVQSAHDILAAVFTADADRQDLADHLAESLAFIADSAEKSAGIRSGARSAADYVRTFAPLLQNHRHSEARQITHSWINEWRRSA